DYYCCSTDSSGNHNYIL
nr:immunoglobulin light chain junction region [Macaca mulatta]